MARLMAVCLLTLMATSARGQTSTPPGTEAPTDKPVTEVSEQAAPAASPISGKSKLPGENVPGDTPATSRTRGETSGDGRTEGNSGGAEGTSGGAGETSEGAGETSGGAGATSGGGIHRQVENWLNDVFDRANGIIGPVLFVDISFGAVPDPGVPLIVVFLLLGAIFFTFRFGFINIRLFGHAIAVIRGRYDDPDDHGEVSHFQALTSALSATVGLGNIAGVALAISGGGAGAVFWMWLVAFFGMSSKFASCTLAQAYRQITEEDATSRREHVLGGPMIYLSRGMRDVFGPGFGTVLGKVLAVSFALFAIGGALGGGNLFQSNQTAEIFSYVLLDGDQRYDWLFGLGMAVMVGLVIVGGIRRIGEVTCRIVPAMCVFYCIICVVILAANLEAIPALFGSIFAKAWDFEAAGWGGFVGIMVLGIKRGAFSNEAGLGSAAIAHSAAKTAEPVREGVVAMTGPFIDTIVVCTMTALTILVTQGQFAESELGSATGWTRGAAMTAQAFGTLSGYLPVFLCLAVFVFALSTMISWGYYGERATEYLFGKRGIWPYRAVFLLFVLIGPMLSIANVLDFTDLLILSMAYPNILGVVILSPKVAKLARNYVARLKSGQILPRQLPPRNTTG